MLYHVVPGILHYVFNYSMHLKTHQGGEKGVFLSHRVAWEAAKGAPFTLSLGNGFRWDQVMMCMMWHVKSSDLHGVDGLIKPMATMKHEGGKMVLLF